MTTRSPLYWEIEGFVAHQNSKLWQIHRDFYQEAGTQAFTQQDVPYNISSNPGIARQCVELLTNLKPEGPTKVLELGAGSGIFALNFLRQWQQLCPERVLEYWLSDYALSSLQALDAHSAFAPYIKNGQLKLLLLDGLKPDSASDLEGQNLDFPETGFQLILGQYFFSTFPCAILMQQGEDWFEQETALRTALTPDTQSETEQAFWSSLAQGLRQDPWLAQIPEAHPQRAMFESLNRAREKVAQQLETPEFQHNFSRTQPVNQRLKHALSKAWASELNSQVTSEMEHSITHLVLQALESHFCPPESWQMSFKFSPKHDALNSQAQQELSQLLGNKRLVAFNYAPGMLRCVRGLLPYLSEGGLFFFGDKAYAELPSAGQPGPESPARHGQSLSHPVNFPLLASVLQAEGCQVQRSRDVSNAFHCLIAQKPPASVQFEQYFKDAFGPFWSNEISHALLEGGYALMQQGQLEAALRHFHKALSYRPEDGTLQYFAAVCLLHEQEVPQALELLERQHDDIFEVLNRDVLLGEAYRLTGQYPKALSAYQRSLRYGENALTHLHLAHCHKKLNATEQAEISMQKARELASADPEFLTELEAEWAQLNSAQEA